MKIVRFRHNKRIKWGILEKDKVIALKEAPYSKIIKSKATVTFKKIKLLTPATPSKVILVGLNYKDHAEELNMKTPDEPIIFIKPSTSIIAHNEGIIYPEGIKRLDYEAELALVIKKKAKNISKKDAHKYILGYTCLNDVTARDIQKKDGQWTRSKSFDTFCPIGPHLETALKPSNLKIRTYLNGKIRQDSSTKNFIFGVTFLVSFISKIMTLLPGDIISTGTPKGIGSMKKGDTVEIEIEDIGRLKNRIS